MPTAICLVSGGLDSCVCAALAAQAGHRLAFLHINYGQRTEARELRAFHEIADHYDVTERLVSDIQHLKRLGGSALTQMDISVPTVRSPAAGVPVTYVPFRNANILAIAVSWAELLEAATIFMGAVEIDVPYPDCRQEFFEAFNQVIRTGSRRGDATRIETPLIRMTKHAIVLRGIELKAPLHLTWSCYQNGDLACGVCDSCFQRLEGFRMAGVADPIPYVPGS